MLAGALDAQGPPPGAIHLRIRCDGEIVYFKVGLQVSIGAVFEAFAERKRVGVDQLRFRVEGADSDVSDTVPPSVSWASRMVLPARLLCPRDRLEARRMAAGRGVEARRTRRSWPRARRRSWPRPRRAARRAA